MTSALHPFRPRRRDIVLLIGGGAALALAGCASDRDPSQDEPSFYQNLTKGGQLDPVAAASMISGYRRNNGLGVVALDPVLMRLAQEQAGAMAAKNKLDHNVGRDFKTRMTTSGFDARMAVENVSAGYHTLAEAFSGWRDSPPHRANMLSKEATRMGIGAVYAPSTKYRVFWALILAAPDQRSDAAGPAAGQPHQWGMTQQVTIR
ncbi:MAG: CAP domain-containing protein [Rhodoplanes sp.]|uniref:CAP domain-containing protein n=1 Tax=Rhodoplanes sp. TaxID=1968906 RepID=UPI00179AF431|nr:CAP domain-containing protein [Rhodoplanes sp.]NVO12841.1 CAP domain-containing protein [Rhodoplanes sp.]